MSELSTPSVPMRAASVPTHWQLPLLAVVLSWAWILFLFRDTAAAMVGIWARSETFMHGFFVPPLALWLIWRLRGALWPLVPKANPWMLLALAISAFAWLVGDMAQANAPSQFALVALLVLAVPCLLGWPVTRVVLFPLGFLFFSVPFGEFMLDPLMEGTATFTVRALQLTGIPVYREGLQFVIPSGAWSVVEACSGVRYLIASVTVGTLYAHLNYQSARRRWMFIGVSVLVPIFANWLRAYLIVLLGHLTSNQLGAGVDHLIYGWVFFGVVIMLMFMIGARWADSAPPPTTELASFPTDTSTSSGRLLGTTAALAALLLVPHLAASRLAPALDGAQGPVLTAPASLSAAWTQAPQPPVDWKPAFRNPSSESVAGYVNGEAVVGLYVGYYRNQSDDRKLVSSTNALVESSNRAWKKASGGPLTLQLNGDDFNVRAAELRSASLYSGTASLRLRVWQWYWMDGWWTSSDQMAKVYGAFQRLRGKGDESAVVVVFAPSREGSSPDAALEAFTRSNLDAIGAWLRQARAQ